MKTDDEGEIDSDDSGDENDDDDDLPHIRPERDSEYLNSKEFKDFISLKSQKIKEIVLKLHEP